MQNRILAREIGDLSPRSFSRAVTQELLRSFSYAQHHRFQASEGRPIIAPSRREPSSQVDNTLAHNGGINSIDIDQFQGKVLVSGGSDGSVKLWDLEACNNANISHTYRPTASVPRVTLQNHKEGHTSGVTNIGFHPFNRHTFLTASFDNSLKQWSTQTSQVAAHFDLGTKVYCLSTSPIASQPLVACGTQHPHIRMVDLRSGSTARAIPANSGPVLCTAWSPRHERIFVSGHADGRAYVWDVRRAHGPIGMLDMEDSLGVVHKYKHAVASGMSWGQMPSFRSAAYAHGDTVNGLTWTDDGHYIVSAGCDRRIRVWNADTGANTLAGFSSGILNRHPTTQTMIVSPGSLSASRNEVLFWPNEHEILVLDLHEGHILSRLRAPGSAAGFGGQAPRTRVTAIAWRGAGGRRLQLGPEMGGGNAPGGVYSAHADGRIRAWIPQLHGEAEIDDREAPDEDDDVKKRKRKAVDDVFKSLMGKKITFT